MTGQQAKGQRGRQREGRAGATRHGWVGGCPASFPVTMLLTITISAANHSVLTFNLHTPAK